MQAIEREFTIKLSKLYQCISLSFSPQILIYHLFKKKYLFPRCSTNRLTFSRFLSVFGIQSSTMILFQCTFLYY